MVCLPPARLPHGVQNVLKPHVSRKHNTAEVTCYKTHSWVYLFHSCSHYGRYDMDLPMHSPGLTKLIVSSRNNLHIPEDAI